MDTTRMQILQAIEAGQITAQEAARLLDALDGLRGAGERVAHLRVVNLNDERARVDVRLPLPVLEAFARLGVNLGALWGVTGLPSAEDILAAARAGADGPLAEVEDEQRRTRVELSLEPV